MKKTTARISELATMVGGDWSGGEDIVVEGLADLHSAVKGQISFITDRKRAAQKTEASALIVSKNVAERGLPYITVDNPSLAAAVIHQFFLGDDFVCRGISEHAFIGEGCEIANEVNIGPKVVLGNNVRIGSYVTIGPGAVIGDNSIIGDRSYIHPNVTILEGSILGERVIIHSGTVIGSDGFGYVYDGKGNHVKRPHVGFVQIDDNVEIGANVCVDRATFGKTWIKRGSKIDNLVQVAHNVEIGESSILVSQCGISGSSRIGNGVVMGGKSGLSGHLNIGDGVTIAAKAGVTSDVENGAVVSGFPAIPHKKWLRASTSFQRIPDLIREVREIKKKLTEILDKKSAD